MRYREVVVGRFYKFQYRTPPIPAVQRGSRPVPTVENVRRFDLPAGYNKTLGLCVGQEEGKILLVEAEPTWVPSALAVSKGHTGDLMLAKPKMRQPGWHFRTWNVAPKDVLREMQQGGEHPVWDRYMRALNGYKKNPSSATRLPVSTSNKVRGDRV